MIKAVIFDFGGVIAEEGFREGLMAIAKKKNLDEQSFYRTAVEIIFKTGYVTGKAKERAESGAISNPNSARLGTVCRMFEMKKIGSSA